MLDKTLVELYDQTARQEVNAMTLPISIDKLIHGGVVESARIEFKGGFNPNSITHTICAFANDIDNIGGGYIIVGIDEANSMPVLPPRGIPKESVDDTLKKLLNLCHLIEPLFEPIAEPVLLEGSWIIVLWVPGGHGRPYKAPKDVFAKDKSNKRFYIRKFSSTVIASPEEERELFYASSTIPFDDRPNLAARPEDLSRALMREHLRQVGSSLYDLSADMDTQEIAQSMQLLSGPPESLHPRNVGILMFSDQVEQYFRYARIEVVDIPNPTGEGMTERVFSGILQRQLIDALAYIDNYVIQKRTYKHDGTPVAEVVANYPYAAVEELLSNAIYHRSYQIDEPTVVRITPDAMEITSFPGFDRSISQEQINRYDLRCYTYRNRRIGDILKELGLCEGRNTGFPKILEALDRNGSPRPTFRMDEQRGFLTVRLAVHPAFSPQTTNKDKRAREYRSRIAQELKAGPLSLSELSRAMGYKAIPKRLSSAVDMMVGSGTIVRISVGGTRSKLALVVTD